MKFFAHFIVFICSLLMVSSLMSCEKKKQEAKLIIAKQEFSLNKDTERTFVIDCKGKIQNVGDVDVKKVVVTGFCRSCGEEMIPGRWFTSSIQKTPIQKDVINFIGAGDEIEFNFTEVANFMLTNGQKDPELPDKLEVVIQSYEIVE